MKMEIAKLVLEFLRVLVWPSVALGAAILFRAPIRVILSRLRKADLPGGVKIDFSQEIEEAKALSPQVAQQLSAAPQQDQNKGPSIPLTEANARLLKLGLQPSPSGLNMSYYRNLIAQDPNLALAGLRIEIDILLRNLAKGFDLLVDSRDSGGRLLRKLKDSGAVTSEQMNLTMKVLQLCNAAVHGQIVSREDANDVIDIAQILAELYLRWLSWGFDDGWKPNDGKNSVGKSDA